MYGFYVAFAVGMGLSSVASEALGVPPKLQTLVQACKNYQALAPGVKLAPKQFMKTLVEDKVSVVGVILVVMVVVYLFCRWKKRHSVWNIMGDIYCIFGTFCVIAMAVELTQVRNEMKNLSASNPNYQDGDWGFGQVAAIFTWIPPLFDFIYNLKGKETT